MFLFLKKLAYGFHALLIFISILKLLLVYIPLLSKRGSEMFNQKKKKKKSKTNFFKRPQTRKQEMKEWVK